MVIWSFYQEITPECFTFDDAVKWFKDKHGTASVIEFSGLAIRQLVALGQHTKEVHVKTILSKRNTLANQVKALYPEYVQCKIS
jgi:arsenate reductase-like glutaredoxin family protein